MQSSILEFATSVRRAALAGRGSHPIAQFWARYRRNRAAVIGLALVAAIAIVAVLAPVIAPADPFEIGPDRLQAPLTTNLLGTDHLGRDLLSRLLYGARTSILVGILAA